MKKEINIIEIDGRDVRYQSGIATYFDILASYMPGHIKTFKIMFYYSPEIGEIKICEADGELQIFHPDGFPSSVLFDAASRMIAEKLKSMKNIIIKSNCLGYEHFAYMLRNRFYCKTVGVLHCLPRKPPGMQMVNPFFNMDHIVLVCDCAKRYLSDVRNDRPYSVIYNGLPKVKVDTGLPKDDVFRFIFANGWASLKGFTKIIPAIEKVAKKHRIEVVILGGTADQEKDIAAIHGLPIVNVGLVTESAVVEKYHAMSDCALFASETEACSFAAISAIAHALPVISTNAPGLVEIFGKSALYTELSDERKIDSDKYAELMLHVIENKAARIKMGALGHSRYLKKYTAKKMAYDTVAVYEKLIGV